MCVHQEIQQKLYEEIEVTLSKNGIRRADSKGEVDHTLPLTYEMLHEMKYLDAFVMEVLRLYPPVPREAKCLLKDDVLPDGMVVKKGYLLGYHPYTMGRTEAFWGKDCLEFKPERFLNKPKPSPFLFSAFQAGPRICIGQNLALFEMKYVITRLLYEFYFSLEQPKSSVTYVTTITLPIKNGLKVSATSRF